MPAAETLARGRDAFGRQAWAECHEQLSAADRSASLEPADLELLATAASLLGKDTESSASWARAHHAYQGRSEPDRAVRCAFWLAYGLLNRGENARGSGWVARARRLLDEVPQECAERGYLLLPAAFECIDQGELGRAAATFAEAAGIGERFGEADLVALARHGQGRALIRMGRAEEGVSLLDEAMVSVEAGEASPIVVGDVYCSVIAGCMEIFDLRRAREWTEQMKRWCESQADLVAYNGRCLVRRAEILLLHGAWSEAAEAARHACQRCREGPDRAALGPAWYQEAELRRLRGELPEAEEAYRQASRWGCTPQPGLALLRLAQGQVDAAATAMGRALEDTQERRTRSKLLPAHVEIMLSASDLPAARRGAEELAQLAAESMAPLLQAMAAQARGAVLLAEGQAQAALSELRAAWTAWQEIEAPYQAARARILVGAACRALGDEDAADLEDQAARAAFRELGAESDLARLEASVQTSTSKNPGGLSPREIEVLRLVATGQTNRAIAAQLFISERTVERHVSNIFLKLDVPSRAAATAYAYQHQLI